MHTTCIMLYSPFLFRKVSYILFQYPLVSHHRLKIFWQSTHSVTKLWFNQRKMHNNLRLRLFIHLSRTAQIPAIKYFSVFTSHWHPLRSQIPPGCFQQVSHQIQSQHHQDKIQHDQQGIYESPSKTIRKLSEMRRCLFSLLLSGNP